MGRNPTKAAGNRYFESRKRASEKDDRLSSREGAGDLLGVSWSSMADYERGLTRVPVDVVIRMSELYKDPALLNWFCCNECPICRDDLLATEMEDIRGISSLRIKKQREVKNFCRPHPAGPRRIGLAQSSGKSTLPTKE